MKLLFLLDRLVKFESQVAIKNEKNILYVGKAENVPYRYLQCDCYDIELQNGERLLDVKEGQNYFEFLFKIVG